MAITDKQKAIYMNHRKEGKSQDLSAAKAGISERTGRTIDKNKHRGKKGTIRDWQTREDPFASAWDSDVVPLLKQGIFEATFLLEVLQKKYPDKFPDSTLRTLQRKMKRWRALSGPGKTVMFRQIHSPGELGISDFTHPNDIKITINGEPLEHIFYHF